MSTKKGSAQRPVTPASKKGPTPDPKAPAPPATEGTNAPPKPVRAVESVEKCYTQEALLDCAKTKTWHMFDGEGSQMCRACGNHMVQHETVADREARKRNAMTVSVGAIEEVTQGMQRMGLTAPQPQLRPIELVTVLVPVHFIQMTIQGVRSKNQKLCIQQMGEKHGVSGCVQRTDIESLKVLAVSRDHQKLQTFATELSESYFGKTQIDSQGQSTHANVVAMHSAGFKTIPTSRQVIAKAKDSVSCDLTPEEDPDAGSHVSLPSGVWNVP